MAAINGPIQLLDDSELSITPTQFTLAKSLEDGLSEADAHLAGSDSDQETARSAFEAGKSESDQLESLLADVQSAAAAVTEDTLAVETDLLMQNLADGDNILSELDGITF